MKYAALGDTVYFWFAANLTTGSAGDGATPTFAVRKAGASSSAAPTLTGTPTLLSHASYSDGSYEIAVAATTGNGFVVDAEYAVFCSLAISGVNPNGFVGSVLLSTDAPSVFKSTDRTIITGIKTQTDKLADPLDHNYDAGSHKWLNVDTTAQVTNVNDKAGYELSSGERSLIAESVRDVDNQDPAANSLGNDLKYIKVNGGPVTSLASLAQNQIKSAVEAQLSGTHGSGSWESGGAGSGARTVTITVTDGTDPLENAKVRMTNGAESYLVETDVSGEAEFSLDDATWSVAITKPGYQFTPTTLAVTGDTSHTYSMTAISITPSDPGLVTGYSTCLGSDGEPLAGVSVSLQMTKPPTGSGTAFDADVMRQTSGSDGVVQFTGLAPGGTYWQWRGSNRQSGKQIKIASDATSPYSLDNIAGAD